MLVRKKICKKGYLIGYWKGEKVTLIPKYHPDHNPEDYVIEEIEIDDSIEVPRLIDPAETPLAEIKEICEKNDIPFFWIAGMGFHDRDKINLDETTLLEEASHLFIALNSGGTTTEQYRRSFNKNQ